MQDAAFLDVPARLARALLQLAESPEAATGLTQSELAAMVGASRESVNRWLQFYRRRGLIDSASGSIRVLQPEELRRHILEIKVFVRTFSVDLEQVDPLLEETP